MDCSLLARRARGALVSIGLFIIAVVPGAQTGFLSHQASAQQPSSSGPAPASIVANRSHVSAIKGVSFSADRRIMASVAGDTTARVWDVATGRLLATVDTAPEVSLAHVALSPDGARIALATEDAAAVWRIGEKETEAELPPMPGPIKWIVWTADGKWVVVASPASKSPDDDRLQLKVFDTTTWALAREDVLAGTAEGWGVLAEPMSGGSDILIPMSGPGPERLVVWSASTGLTRRSHEVGHTRFAIAPDGRTIAVTQHDSIAIFDAELGDVRTLAPTTGFITALFFAGNGATLYGVIQAKSELHAWDVKSGRSKAVVKAPADTPKLQRAAGAISDGEFVSHTGATLAVRAFADARVVRGFGVGVSRLNSIVETTDGEVIAGGGASLMRWDLKGGRAARRLEAGEHGVNDVRLSADGNRLLIGSQRRLMRVVETDTGRQISAITDTMRELTEKERRIETMSTLMKVQADFDSRAYAFDLSRDGRLVARGRQDGGLSIHDAGTGRLLHQLVEPYKGSGVAPGFLSTLAFSPDGRTLVAGGSDQRVQVWDVAAGRILKQLEGHTWAVRSSAFLPDGRLVTGGGDRMMILWDVSTGTSLRKVEAHDGIVRTLAVSHDGTRIVSGGSEGVVKLWDTASGAELDSFAGHTGEVLTVAISRDGKRVVSGGDDATMKVWSIEGRKLLATFVASGSGDWLVMTPDGFFAASRLGGDFLSIVRNRAITTIEQVHQSLYNPDLVRLALAGDPTGEVAAAAKIISLDRVLDSGPPPDVRIERTVPTAGRVARGRPREALEATAHIRDQGTGVGRIEWRVNGVTAAVDTAAAGAPGKGGQLQLKRHLVLDPGENTIEVIAYNAANLIASRPARLVVRSDARAVQGKGRLHVLAIGIDAYASNRFSPLSYAAKDARTVGAALKQAAGGLYDGVDVTIVTDAKATAENLDRIFERLGTTVKPSDTFVMFASAHGYSKDGRFFLIPQDYPDGLEAIATRAIGQDRLQHWLVNHIKARKAVILLDTCESGALIAGHTVSRLNQPSSEAAIGRLHEATGRPVLTAAASRQAAFEGSRLGHGVFTTALLEALQRADGKGNGNGIVELSELAAYVQARVPELGRSLETARAATDRRREAGPDAGTKGFAAIAGTVSTGATQDARFGSRGEDFALTRTLAAPARP
ncbi:MAG: hypothetical protein R3D27_06065 [Hyphomicrobiaceae bacterium]